MNFSVNNPLGLADLLVHGQNIRGWGQNIPPDQSLLFVRGFDPATKRYKYEVNQRFGTTLPTQSTARVLPLVSLRVQLDIGVPRERQVLTQRLDMGHGRPGTKSTAPLLKSLGSSTIPQAHPTGYPVYRLEWQGLGSLQRRLRNCMTGVRAEPFKVDAPEWVELELYLARRAAGMAMDAPAVRP